MEYFNIMEYINFTTPIYYTSGNPHIGHAYSTFLADTYKRYFGLFPFHVSRFVTGTDEHGLKVQKVAQKSNKSPQELVDELSLKFKKTWNELGIKYDDFIRTTEKRHITVVEDFWNKLVKQGDIYLGQYKGLYCVDCEQYYKLSDLEEGNVCPIHKTPCTELEEESYFFRLSKYHKQLLDFFKTNKDFIRPENRLNEIISVLEKEELTDISISRTSFDWGIKVSM